MGVVTTGTPCSHAENTCVQTPPYLFASWCCHGCCETRGEAHFPLQARAEADRCKQHTRAQQQFRERSVSEVAMELDPIAWQVLCHVRWPWVGANNVQNRIGQLRSHTRPNLFE